MHGHKLHDLKHNEYSNRMVPNVKSHSCSYWYTQAGPVHAAGCGDGMDRWQHSSHLFLHSLLVASIMLLWEEVGVQWLWHRHRELGNKDKQHQQIAMQLCLSSMSERWTDGQTDRQTKFTLRWLDRGLLMLAPIMSVSTGMRYKNWWRKGNEVM